VQTGAATVQPFQRVTLSTGSYRLMPKLEIQEKETKYKKKLKSANYYYLTRQIYMRSCAVCLRRAIL
jgi:hypothetical protein